VEVESINVAMKILVHVVDRYLMEVQQDWIASPSVKILAIANAAVFNQTGLLLKG